MAHFAMIALSLPHFASYATWYFAAEIMLFWCLCGRGVVGFSQWMSSMTDVVLRNTSRMHVPSHWLVPRPLSGLMIAAKRVADLRLQGT